MSKIERVVAGPQSRRVVFRVAGEGRPLLLLHGGYGSWNHWAANIPALARHRQVIAPDLPGLGESDLPEDPASLVSIAGALEDALRDLLGAPARLDVAAFSFGASVAAAMGMASKVGIAHLILVGAGGMRLPRPPSIRLESWQDAPDEPARLAMHRRNLAAFMFGDAARIDDEAVHFQDWNTRKARIKSRALSRQGWLSDYLVSGRHAAPLDGIWGERDVTARGHLDVRRKAIMDVDSAAQFRVIPGAGHWVMRDAAAEVNLVISKMLRRRSSDNTRTTA